MKRQVVVVKPPGDFNQLFFWLGLIFSSEAYWAPLHEPDERALCA